MVYKILGQSRPGSSPSIIATPSVSGQSMVGSSLVACNTVATPVQIEVIVYSPSGMTTKLVNTSVGCFETLTLTLGITLGEGEQLLVSGSGMDFTFFGVLQE